MKSMGPILNENTNRSEHTLNDPFIFEAVHLLTVIEISFKSLLYMMHIERKLDLLPVEVIKSH